MARELAHGFGHLPSGGPPGADRQQAAWAVGLGTRPGCVPSALTHGGSGMGLGLRTVSRASLLAQTLPLPPLLPFLLDLSSHLFLVPSFSSSLFAPLLMVFLPSVVVPVATTAVTPWAWRPL